MITTNQIKTFANQNQYVQSYIDFQSTGRHDFYIKYKNHYVCETHNKINYDFVTFHSNMLYREANNAMLKKFGKINDHELFEVHIEHIKFSCSFTLNKLTGDATIQIKQAYLEEQYFNRLPFIESFYHCFKYVGNIDAQSYIKATENEINKYLYPDGRFRDCQLAYYWNKQTLKLRYKHEIENRNINKYDDDTIINWLNRKFNIIVPEDIDLKQAIKFAKKHGKQDKKITLAIFDWQSVFFACDNCDGDVDELETTYWDAVSNNSQENVVYIN
jgi:hypothetical protein